MSTLFSFVNRTLFLLGLLVHFSSNAQVYDTLKSQHRFAQTYVGFNAQYVPSSGSLVWADQSLPFPTTTTPRFTIGGVHFWGKLDFNMNIPLITLSNTGIASDGFANFRTGADLSARYYPWRLKYGKLRPMVGVSFNTMQLELGDVSGERAEGYITTSFIGGLSVMIQNWRLNAEVMYMPDNKRAFYSNLTDRHLFELPPLYFSLGIVHHFDFTLPEEKRKKTGETDAVEALLLEKNKLNSFSLGIAPNSSYFTQFPEFSGQEISLPRHKGSFNLEFGLGYLFHKAKTHVGLTYRTYDSRSLSYNIEHIIRREALSLEIYRFLLNYNGFVPFAGVSLSGERWATGLFYGNEQQGETLRTQLFSPGIIFGWDIVASPVDTWVLRTNLRYYPFQRIETEPGVTSRVDQFEFNFIQFVWYPNRFVNVRKARKQYRRSLN